jgi:hypothetical protein
MASPRIGCIAVRRNKLLSQKLLKILYEAYRYHYQRSGDACKKNNNEEPHEQREK